MNWLVPVAITLGIPVLGTLHVSTMKTSGDYDFGPAIAAMGWLAAWVAGSFAAWLTWALS